MATGAVTRPAWHESSVKYLGTLKGGVELTVLIKRCLQWIKLCKPDAEVGRAIQATNVTTSVLGFPTFINKLFSIGTKDPFSLDWWQSLVGSVKYGYYSLAFLGQDGMRLLQVPSIVDKIGFTACVAGILDDFISLYKSGKDFVEASEKLGKILINIEEEQQKDRRFVSGLKASKSLLKILAGLAGLFLIVWGKAVVSGVVLLAINTVSLVTSIFSSLYEGTTVDAWLKNA